jgi:hypothetical protein
VQTRSIVIVQFDGRQGCVDVDEGASTASLSENTLKERKKKEKNLECAALALVVAAAL